MPRKIDVYVVTVNEPDQAVRVHSVHSVHRTVDGAHTAVQELLDPCSKCGCSTGRNPDDVQYYSFPLQQ